MEYYKQVIELLANGDLDWREISIQLAKEHPDLFVKYASIRVVPAWMRDVIAFVREEKYVDSIKLLRTQTRYGLKEAKDVIDNLRDRMGYQGWNGSHFEPNRNLTADQQVILGDLLRAAGK